MTVVVLRVQEGFRLASRESSYRMKRMLRSLVPLVLIAIIGASPMVREFCRIACNGAPSGTSSHAHHAEAAVPEHEMAAHDMGGTDSSAPAVSHHEHGAAGPAGTSEHSFAECCVPALGPRRDCCDDADPRLTSTVAAKQLVAPPALVPPVIARVARVDTVIRSPFETSARPPVPLTLRTPLRV